MLVTAYCLCHYNWVVRPRHIRENYEDIAQQGFNAVALSFSEDDAQYCQRTFEFHVNEAHKVGLKVLVIPSRLGNRFAGAPYMPSPWLAAHPEAQIPNFTSHLGAVGCVESPLFQEWIKGFMKKLLNNYDLDGIIWDEPKYTELASSHPDSIKVYGHSPTPDQVDDHFLDFFSDLCGFCATQKKDCIQTLFCSPSNREYFTSRAPKIKEISYAGYDGPLAPCSYFKEMPIKNKKYITDSWERTKRECKEAGVKTFALIENILLAATNIEEFSDNLHSYLKMASPEHIAFYYYGHNNEKPELIQKIVSDAIRSLKK
ncbi:MAG: hypothetical protein WCS73_08360 [Lentisphaeria bacterium]